MLATKTLDYAAQPQQIINEAKSVSSLAQKNKGGSDFKDILAPKLEEKAESTPDSLAASVSASIEEPLGNKNSDKLKPGEAAEMVKALLKVLKALKDKKAAAGEALPATDKTSLLNLLTRLEEFIKKGLKQGFPGEKDNFKRLKELRQEIFAIITAGSANGTAQAAAVAAEKSEEIGVSLPSAGDNSQKKEKPLHLTLVDLRKDRAAGKSAALTPASSSAPGKETALSEAVSEVSGVFERSESSRQSMPADQILIRTFSFETGESKGGVEGVTNLSDTFRRFFIPEIVRQSGIILKDGGKGEIRLILKPESLGRVRIRINIQDNSIEGKILVENNTVRELFEGNMEHLKNALRSEGLDSAALEVAVGGEKSGRDPGKEGFSSMSKEGALDEFERSMPLLADFYREDLLIDLVV